jgi:hypothetical protein
MAERDSLMKQRVELERKLARYRAGHVDSDYVEERALSQLGLAGPNDIVLSFAKNSSRCHGIFCIFADPQSVNATGRIVQFCLWITCSEKGYTHRWLLRNHPGPLLFHHQT